MPVNNHGRPVMHRGLRQLIYAGQFYPGREIGLDGEYLPEQKEEASDTGASSEITKLPPAEWPPRETLAAMELPELKAWATAQGVKFHPNSGRDKVLDAVDVARATVEGDQ